MPYSVDFNFAKAATVGAKNLSDTAQDNLRLGGAGELIVAQMWGKYGELCKRGCVFSARSVLQAIPLQTALTNSPTLWNPSTSGKIVIPISIAVSPGTVGTPVIHGLTLSFLINTGATVAATLPIATFTEIAETCCYVGSAKVASAMFAAAVDTFTVNPALLMDLGMMHWLEGTAASGCHAGYSKDLDGMVLMRPGTSISVGATAATSTLYATTIVWAEVPDFGSL
jgi:hypothetical protein